MGAVKNYWFDQINSREPDDEMDPEVCTNCGAYFDARTPSKWQRCPACLQGLEQVA